MTNGRWVYVIGVCDRRHGSHLAKARSWELGKTLQIINTKFDVDHLKPLRIG